MATIEYDGISCLIEDDAKLVKMMVEEYTPKIERAIKNEFKLHVHVKSTDKGGHQHLISINIKCEAPTQIFEAHYEDYELPKVVHKTCGAILTQIESRFKDQS